jgi:hypothetical protein
LFLYKKKNTVKQIYAFLGITIGGPGKHGNGTWLTRSPSFPISKIYYFTLKKSFKKQRLPVDRY